MGRRVYASYLQLEAMHQTKRNKRCAASKQNGWHFAYISKNCLKLPTLRFVWQINTLAVRHFPRCVTLCSRHVLASTRNERTQNSLICDNMNGWYAFFFCQELRNGYERLLYNHKSITTLSHYLRLWQCCVLCNHHSICAQGTAHTHDKRTEEHMLKSSTWDANICTQFSLSNATTIIVFIFVCVCVCNLCLVTVCTFIVQIGFRNRENILCSGLVVFHSHFLLVVHLNNALPECMSMFTVRAARTHTHTHLFVLFTFSVIVHRNNINP